MSCDWPIVKLSEIVNFKTGRLDSNQAEDGGSYPFFTCSPATLAINTYAFDDEVVLLAGNNANGVFTVKYYKGKFNAYQRTYVITPIDSTKVSVRWLYFRIKHVTTELQQLSVGSATKFLTKKILDAFEIALPPYEEQEKIADVLWSLQNKLDNSCQINQTLEAMAQAIFKSWFVDFEPVKAKIAAIEAGEDAEGVTHAAMSAISGKTYEELDQLQAKQPKHYTQLKTTAELFPAAIQDSEFGEIPFGWIIRTLGSLLTELRRGISPKYIDEGGIIVINQKCIRNHSVNFSLARRNDTKLQKVEGREIQVGDVLVNSTGVGTLGRLATIRYLPEPAVVDSHITVVRASDEISPLFLNEYMLTKESFIEASGAGSTGQTELRRQVLEELFIVVPNHTLIDSFETMSKPISSSIAEREQECQLLTQIRDTLLPKLLSGELETNNVDKMES